MHLQEVEGKELIHQFHLLPFSIYKNDPHWVPHLIQDIEKIFDQQKNKLYKEGATAIRWILLDDKGEKIGRIAAFINPKDVDTTQFKTGGLGFFECINDQTAANFLFDAGKAWLENQGMEAMDGPINFGDRSQFWGCQVTNWDEPGIYPMNYNPPYYQDLFINYGFGVYFNQHIYWRSLQVKPQAIFYRKYNNLKSDPKFTVSNIRGMNVDEVAENFKTVYNAAWGGHSHFKPMTTSGSQKVFRAIKQVMDPNTIIFAYYDGAPIGLFLCIPELNQIFKHVNGNLNAIGKIKFLYHKLRRTTTRLVGVVFGVVREWHGKGVEAALVVEGEISINARGNYNDFIITWIGDFNPKMIKVAENLDTQLWRTLQTYRYQFDRSLPFERCPVVE
jgi:hypothetical protein